MGRGIGIQTVKVLNAIAEGCKHGFEIIQYTGCHSATVYRSLHRLDALEWVVSRWEDPAVSEEAGRPRRKYYTLTSEGAKALARLRSRLSGIGPSHSAERA